MKISVVMPIYNCCETVEQTLLSIFSQTYQDYELIIVDGGSTDGTLGVLEKYREKIHLCVSEKDNGQYDAINKGFTAASGDIFSWINGDDIYLPGAFSTAASVFNSFSDVNWIMGLPGFLNEKGEYVRIDSSPAAFPRKFIMNGKYQTTLCGYLQQESMFWRRELWQKCEGLNLGLKLAADFDLWTRFAQKSDLVPVLSPLAAFRFLPGQQRSSLLADEYLAEVKSVCESFNRPFWLWSWLSKRGQVVRSFLRLLIWRRTEVIIYNRESECWKKPRFFCSVSRRSLINLISDYYAR